MKIALSDDICNRLRITYKNCPIVRSIGTKYLRLSNCGVSLEQFGFRSTITGIRSGYLLIILSASVKLLSGFDDKKEFENSFSIIS